MGNHPKQFEDLILNQTDCEPQVEGTQGGLTIKCTGTFTSHIKDDEGVVNKIKVPNSKYVPGLKCWILLPQHWGQQAQDKYPLTIGTKIEDDNKALILK